MAERTDRGSVVNGTQLPPLEHFFDLNLRGIFDESKNAH